jgi:hypothetical protein
VQILIFYRSPPPWDEKRDGFGHAWLGVVAEVFDTCRVLSYPEKPDFLNEARNEARCAGPFIENLEYLSLFKYNGLHKTVKVICEVGR